LRSKRIQLGNFPIATAMMPQSEATILLEANHPKVLFIGFSLTKEFFLNL
jgi:hypothetical protein